MCHHTFRLIKSDGSHGPGFLWTYVTIYAFLFFVICLLSNFTPFLSLHYGCF